MQLYAHPDNILDEFLSIYAFLFVSFCLDSDFFLPVLGVDHFLLHFKSETLTVFKVVTPKS